MEFLKGLRIKDILLDNNNWWQFFMIHGDGLRHAIIANVLKILICRTKVMGSHVWFCQTCQSSKTVYHSCKSRFCTSCGKKATDQWVNTNIAKLPNTAWQHITFTMPKQLWNLFWLNRDILNELAPIPAQIMTELAKKKSFIPGIFMAIHSFGRDLKRNIHFHLSITLHGLTLDKTDWNSHRAYFHHAAIKKMWRARVLKKFLSLYSNGKLKLPASLANIKSIEEFKLWLKPLHSKQWVVHLSKPNDDHNKNVKYLGRYIKRPPISETNIKTYDGEFVTYSYLDHQSNHKVEVKMTVMEFIKRLITHIPDNNFRMIRYYNWLSNRTIGKYLPMVYEWLNQNIAELENTRVRWRDLYIKTFGIDPLKCKNCNGMMVLGGFFFPMRVMNVFKELKNISIGKYC